MRPFLLFLSAGLVPAPGCKGDPRVINHYQVTVPREWKSWSLSIPPPQVPGKVLEAYDVPSQGGSGSLVFFRSSYLPETRAQELLTQTRYLVLNLPSLNIEEAKEIEVGGKPAVLLSAVAAGNGRELAPTGLGKPQLTAGAPTVETRRIWVRVPRGREEGTFEVLFHCPEREFGSLASAWQGVLESLQP